MDSDNKAQRKTHPALCFLGDSAQEGIIDLDYQGWIVDSSREQRSAAELNTRGSFTVAPLAYEGVVGRWDEDDLKRFLTGESGPTVGKVLRDMMEIINHYVTLKRPQEAGLVACWVVGTYF